MKSVSRIFIVFLSVCFVFFAVENTFGQVSTDEILVLASEDFDAVEKGKLFVVDPENGERTILSNFTDSSQGVEGFFPVDLAIRNNGNILVIDTQAGTDDRGLLFSINPMDGSRTVLSDFSDGTQGPTGNSPNSVAVESSGSILVLDRDRTVDTPRNPVLFRVGPDDGSRTLLSDFNDSTQGDTVTTPFDLRHVTVALSGDIFVTGNTFTDRQVGLLFKIDPDSGHRELIQFNDPDPSVFLGSNNFEDVHITSLGEILVVDVTGPLLSIDFDSATQMDVSVFGEEIGLSGVSTDSADNIFVITQDGGTGVNMDGREFSGLYGVSDSGMQTLLSDFGIVADGPTSVSCIDLEVYPFIDTDGDGVADTNDACQDSDLSETVEIDGCDSGVTNELEDNGCTISDTIQDIGETASNHGQFASNVSHYTNDLKNDGVISGSDKGAIQDCAASADIP